MIFQGLSVARNCLRPETAPLTVLAIKRGLLCNFAKTFRGRHFMGYSSTDLTFPITIEFQIFKPFFAQSFKKYIKNTYFGPKENRLFFSNIALILKCRHFCIKRFDKLRFYNILHLEINFVNLY